MTLATACEEWRGFKSAVKQVMMASKAASLMVGLALDQSSPITPSPYTVLDTPCVIMRLHLCASVPSMVCVTSPGSCAHWAPIRLREYTVLATSCSFICGITFTTASSIPSLTCGGHSAISTPIFASPYITFDACCDRYLWCVPCAVCFSTERDIRYTWSRTAGVARSICSPMVPKEYTAMEPCWLIRCLECRVRDSSRPACTVGGSAAQGIAILDRLCSMLPISRSFRELQTVPTRVVMSSCIMGVREPHRIAIFASPPNEVVTCLAVRPSLMHSLCSSSMHSVWCLGA
mmetsp:Transcript_28616/g.63485  ORF Transcript_28616/g.63485 Transcript_28616/m.63485 type:complete len:290 (-) Transcript_28616:648-1517(-)